MVYMGRNLISKTTEGIWTKLKPEVSHALPWEFSGYTKPVSESNVEIPYSSSQTSPKPQFRIKKQAPEVPPETRTSLISLPGSTVVHSFSTLPRPYPPRGLWHSLIYVGLISKITLMSASGLP